MVRVFFWLMLVCFVIGFALMVLGPDGLTLADAISVVDVMAVFRAQEYAMHHLPHYMWDEWAMAWLLRPAWLVPVIVGVICGGAAAVLVPPQPEKRR